MRSSVSRNGEGLALASQFDPARFWNARLSKDPSLRGTGHRAFSLAYNDLLYAAQAEALVDLLNKWHIDLKGKIVLDVGSGVGFYVSFFQSYGAHHLVGMDIAESGIRHLRMKFPQYEFHLADIGSADVVLDRRFDLVSVIGVLYHLIDDNQFERALYNLVRLTKVGGYLIASDRFVASRFAPRHVHFRSLNRYVHLLRECGMEILDTTPIYYLMNRVFVPMIGPMLLGRPTIARALFRIDQHWRRAGRPNGSGVKFLLAKRVMQTI